MRNPTAGTLAPHLSAAFSLAVAVLGPGEAAESVVRGAAGQVAAEPEQGDVASRMLVETRQRARAALCISGVPEDERQRRALVPLSVRPDRPNAVVAAMAALPDDQRAAMQLAYFGCYTFQEIAALTGLPVTSVRAAITTAARALVAARAS